MCILVAPSNIPSGMLKLCVYITEINTEIFKLSTDCIRTYSAGPGLCALLFIDICELTYWKYSSAEVLSSVLLFPLLIHDTAEEFLTRHSAVVQSAAGEREREREKEKKKDAY